MPDPDDSEPVPESAESDPDDGDELDELDELGLSANATAGNVAMAAPTPKATASAPTRPT